MMQFLRITDGALDIIKQFNIFSPTVSLSHTLKPIIGFGHIIHPDDYYDSFKGTFLSHITYQLHKYFDNRKDVNHFLAIVFPKLITRKMACNMLRNDLKPALKTLRNTIISPLKTYQVSALLSLIYDIGCQKFEKSNIIKYINNNDLEGAANIFMSFTDYAPYVQKIYALKRQKEKTLFLS